MKLLEKIFPWLRKRRLAREAAEAAALEAKRIAEEKAKIQSIIDNGINTLFFEKTLTSILVAYNLGTFVNESGFTTEGFFNFSLADEPSEEWYPIIVNAEVNHIKFINLKKDTKYVFKIKIHDKEFTKFITTPLKEGISEFENLTSKQLKWDRFEIELDYKSGTQRTVLQYSLDDGTLWKDVFIPNDDESGKRRFLIVDKNYKSKAIFRTVALANRNEVGVSKKEIYFFDPVKRISYRAD